MRTKKNCYLRLFLLSTCATLSTIIAQPAQAFRIFVAASDVDISRNWENAMKASGAESFSADTFDSTIENATSITFDSGVVSTGVGGSLFNAVNNDGTQSWQGRIDTDNDSPQDAFELITWSFPQPIVGFLASFRNNPAGGEVLQISGNFDGTGDEVIDLLDILEEPRESVILGIVGDVPFSQITFQTRGSSPFSSATDEFFEVDNLRFASVSQEPQPVNEPLIGLGSLVVVGLSELSRRKKLLKSPGHAIHCSQSVTTLD